MRRECHIIAPDRRQRADRVARCVLGADEGREEQTGSGHEVGEEAEDVAGGVVDGVAGGGAPPQVEEGLGVEG